MTETRGHTTGFDVLRVGFAIFVLCWHSVYVTHGLDGFLWESPLRPIGAIPIPMFFALSGFLVANSIVRAPSISAFVVLRVLRLGPALLGLVFFTTLILGPAVTSMPLAAYFTAPEFWAYWLNVVGDVRYILPGVFYWPNLVKGIVNISLWTIPYELACYAGLSGLFVLGILRRPREVLLTFCLISLVLTVQQSFTIDGFDDSARPSGLLLAICFFAGVVLYAFRFRVSLRRRWFAASLVLSLLLLVRADTAFLAPLPIAYATVYIGLLNLPRIPVLMGGDYSYGIYLYAFPMQQLYMWVDPLKYYRFAPYHHVWWVNIAFALPLTIICAMVSWTFIEAPVMSRRKLLTEQARRVEETAVAQLRAVAARLLAYKKTFS
jgi:peptidoglycan/LPS O-acetylase OafA/YrhL